MNYENMIKILQTISDKLEANEIGYDEEYAVLQYCQLLLHQKEIDGEVE